MDRPNQLLVLDAEGLTKLDANTPRERWVEALSQAGLLHRLERDSSDEARIVAEMRRTLDGWKPRGFDLGRRLRSPMVIAFLTIAVGLCVYAAINQIGGGMFCLVGCLPVFLVPDQTANDVGPWPEAERLATLVRRLLSRTFVTVVDGVVIEHVPHCAVLRSRLLELDRAEALHRARALEIRATRQEIAKVNARMGRPVEDVETERLTELLTVEDSYNVRLVAMRAALTATLQRTEAVLGDLRMTAIRRALSDKTAKLASSGDPMAQSIAGAEVDLAGMRARLEELGRETDEAEAQLRALLES